MTPKHRLGQFVRVGDSLGVLVALASTEDEDHCTVWYGELMADGVTPLARTVPCEYCLAIDGYGTYH